MKKLVGLIFLLAISLPLVAQVRLSIRDQQRFDSYYSRWQQYKQVNDRDQIVSMEKRMLDVYAHYGIAAGTPFWRIATNGHPEHPRWRERLNRDERRQFDELYSHWIGARNSGNRWEVAKLEHRMREIMQRNGIPGEVRLEEIASH
ncbi:MAG TPA: hypothetical protein VH596_00690 [Terriglobales bacterium]